MDLGQRNLLLLDGADAEPRGLSSRRRLGAIRVLVGLVAQNRVDVADLHERVALSFFCGGGGGGGGEDMHISTRDRNGSERVAVTHQHEQGL